MRSSAMRAPKGIWKPLPLYLVVYNVIRTLTTLQGGQKETYFTVEEIYEAVKSDSHYRDVDLSVKDVVRAIMILELNGLVKTFSNGEDIMRLSVALVKPNQ